VWSFVCAAEFHRVYHIVCSFLFTAPVFNHRSIIKLVYTLEPDTGIKTTIVIIWPNKYPGANEK